ncbi:MAG: AAA family ATPase, partial [Bacilli bacterium]
HLIGEGKIIKKCVDAKRVFSMIFYGPPGTGKTTLASVIANELELPYRLFNAVTGNKKDLEIIFNEAKYLEGLIVIVDEVHRLNKDKQDLLLPHIENGNITLIGATTANPFHSINPAIRSRCQLLEIKPLEIEDITKALQTALLSPNGLNNEYSIEYQSLVLIAKSSNGDIRFALNLLEICSIA